VSTGTLHGQRTQSAAVLAQQFQQQKLITSGKITKAEVTQATRQPARQPSSASRICTSPTTAPKPSTTKPARTNHYLAGTRA
jgi:uncharacterized SAM-binding protein YcdF (DUF218 family)